ncbi:hypothetical protein CH63R_13713 [Colletotrichum higginsianum IMI 349063]|uniref:Uncharacterized protein n=1 Tax=Colletotrichum higginsianum (strain IMI 349063) TaxID=759273 RepID=A0A1B7XRX6_COLHI|nr:hypothetical protein CH63R_13713 [Colletotrichum higginsianum IMI 349063]OBR02487.1 hypothetical protein CH63R_13713 [Colletotrichum higginsianum IMI 349063]
MTSADTVRSEAAKGTIERPNTNAGYKYTHDHMMRSEAALGADTPETSKVLSRLRSVPGTWVLFVSKPILKQWEEWIMLLVKADIENHKQQTPWLPWRVGAWRSTEKPTQPSDRGLPPYSVRAGLPVPVPGAESAAHAGPLTFG